MFQYRSWKVRVLTRGGVFVATVVVVIVVVAGQKRGKFGSGVE